MWLWTVIGVLGVVTLIFMMGKLFRKEQYVYDPPVK